MILSLARFGIALAEHVKVLEKRWAARRIQNGLDRYGGRVVQGAVGATSGTPEGRVVSRPDRV
ncbi:MAG TPA: hypothetical protein VKB88_23600 [Bryobacteraceae bacterium]|nr:hypothetical protein [Bryobacteraceae bacterium]